MPGEFRSRRKFLFESGAGLSGLGLASLLAQDGLLGAEQQQKSWWREIIVGVVVAVIAAVVVARLGLDNKPSGPAGGAVQAQPGNLPGGDGPAANPAG